MKKIISYTFVFIVFVFTILTFASTLFGYRYYAVKSDSMYPAISKYSLVYIKKNDTNMRTHLELNQVIAINTGSVPLMHRIISINGDQIITHGDNNRVGVNEEVNYNNVIGVVKFSIPFIGMLFLNKLTIPIIILFVIIIIISKEIFKELKNRR